LLTWPVPISPQAWNAPLDNGFQGAFAQNTRLGQLSQLSIGDYHGPEDVAARQTKDGLRLYVSTQNGDILELDPVKNTYRVYAQTGGVPLGIEFDKQGHLIVADAH